MQATGRSLGTKKAAATKYCQNMIAWAVKA